MTIFSFDLPILHLGLWLCSYLLLALAHTQLESWLVTRFQNRRPSSLQFVPTGLDIRWTDLPSALLALLTGAFIPLTSDLAFAGRTRSLHLFAHVNAGLFLTLALFWLNSALLKLGERRWQGSAADLRYAMGIALSRSLPTLLIVTSVLIVGSAISPYSGVGSQLSTLVRIQGGWNGLRWLLFLQPVALLLWMCSTLPLVVGSQARTRVAGRLWTLNYDLLTGAILLGGWQGPGVERLPWLGLAYCAIKVGLFACLRTWASASQPTSDLQTVSRRIWAWYTPLSALNLLVTASVVAWR